jgi:hypothetical protein
MAKLTGIPIKKLTHGSIGTYFYGAEKERSKFLDKATRYGRAVGCFNLIVPRGRLAAKCTALHNNGRIKLVSEVSLHRH